MNCCIYCFADQGLHNRIKAISIAQGICDFCKSKDVHVIDCASLSEIFSPVFDSYIPLDKNTANVKQDAHRLLYQHLVSYWPKLFNCSKLIENDIKLLVHHIGTAQESNFNMNLFETPVDLKIYSEDNLTEETYTLQWEKFTEEIKQQNRFFIMSPLALNDLDSVFNRLSTTYPTGTEFYRARISDVPLNAQSLGKPPHKKATSGRANPIGIPYLYLSDKEETTLYETRVSLHESISVAKFILIEPLQVVSLKEILNYGPFDIQDKGFEIEEFMRIRPYLLKLEEELSKPVQKQDVNLDYLPTQYLCEFIKSLGFDAVEYRSAMAEGGYNLAVFNDKKLTCSSVRHYEVTGLKYQWE